MSDLKLDVVRCRRCHRILKDEACKKLGYGKICYEKCKPKNTNYLFEVNYEITNEGNIQKDRGIIM